MKNGIKEKKGRRLFYDSVLILIIGSIIFLILNLILGLLYFVADEEYKENPGALSYGIDKARLAYPKLPDEEIRELLKENWYPKLEYHPYTQVMHTSYSGKYVNISKEGFRYIKKQASWPPSEKNINVFIFGGSTTYGAGVADHQTIASQLQEQLRDKMEDIAIYNFGVGSFYSTQERIFLEILLEKGFNPDVVIFIDGINDLSYDYAPTKISTQTKKTQKLTEMFKTQGSLRHEKIILKEIKDIFTRLPVNRAVASVMRKISNKETKDADASEDNELSDENLKLTIQRYLINKKIIESIAMNFGFKTLFIWQPTPTYKYERKKHLFYPYGMGSRASKGYELMQKLVDEKHEALQKNFLDLSSLQEAEEGNLYVDAVHYTPYFNNVIAKHVANNLIERGILYK